MKLKTSPIFEKFIRNIKLQKSFTLTGLTSFSRLFALKYVKEFSGKKVLFVTSTEQSALRYSVDLERLFEFNPVILPYKNVSPYEALTTNFYDYAKQINVLRERPDFVIAPAKVLTEKFPEDKFFDENRLALKVGFLSIR